MSASNNFPPAPQNPNNQQPTPPVPPPPAPSQATSPYPAPQSAHPQENKSGAFYESLKNAGTKVKNVSADQANRLKEANAQRKTNGEGLESAGFFKALFDLNFYHFITIKYAKLIYILNIAFIVLSVVGLAFITFAVMAYNDEAGSGFLFALLILIGGGIWGILSIIGIRLVLELFVAIIRVAENTTFLRKQLQETTEVIKEKK